MSFFTNGNASSGAMGAQDFEKLNKALEAGYGTDSSTFTGGRALIPENLESDTINVVNQLKSDCKVMASVRKVPVKSTVHEVNVRDQFGDYKHNTVAEAGESLSTSQGIKRKYFETKYLQSLRSVTEQMNQVEAFESAYASEKLAGLETIIQSAEYLNFHGDSDVVPTEYDGFISAINKAPEKEQNIINMKGQTLGSVDGGEKLFRRIGLKVYQNGGTIEKAFFPPVLAENILEMFDERMRFFPTSNTLAVEEIPMYPLPTGGSIKLSGDTAGSNKFFEPKTTVFASGDAVKRPPKPQSVTVIAKPNTTGSLFESSDEGDYMYSVHAKNQYGISAKTEISVPVSVAKGSSVEITITPEAGVDATGFVICRSKKNGTEMMEMISIPNSGKDSTVFTDINSDIPGTASMLFLPRTTIQPIYAYGQLSPARTFPLFSNNKAETPFLVMMFGALEVRAPKQFGLVKNIAYNGGL
ncbi:MAG: hypothetical protein ACRC4W_00115 [Treponemataceae bacterium]